MQTFPPEEAVAAPFGVGIEPSSIALVLLGAALVACLFSLIWWALSERRERQASQRQNSELSTACRLMIEQHYRERVQAEERHLLTHDSTVRNILESLERSVLGRQKS